MNNKDIKELEEAIRTKVKSPFKNPVEGLIWYWNNHKLQCINRCNRHDIQCGGIMNHNTKCQCPDCVTPNNPRGEY